MMVSGQCGVSVAMFELARSTRRPVSQVIQVSRPAAADLAETRAVPSAAAVRASGNGAAGGQSNISVAPAPSNNRLKLTARGRPTRELRPRRTRAAA